TSARRVAVTRAPRRYLRALGSPAQLVGGGALIAYDPTPATTRVLETATGETFDVATPDTCRLAATGAGRVLFGCPPTDLYAYALSDPLVLDAEASSWSRPSPFAERDRADQPYSDLLPAFVLDGIGARWISGTLSVLDYDTELHIPDYLPYGSGGPSRQMWPQPNQVIDLDSPSALRGVCGPIKRSEYGGLLRFQRPWALERRRGGALRVQRCGSGRRPTLSNCPQNCTATRLDGGVATWIETAQVHLAAAAHPHPVFVARLPGGMTAVTAIPAHGTAYVLARRFDGATRPSAPRLYAVPLPRWFGRR
ncbi:MAG TPA: hypothetical protein VGI54_03725, partial [Solirubrobacteraceae bacterium]